MVRISYIELSPIWYAQFKAFSVKFDYSAVQFQSVSPQLRFFRCLIIQILGESYHFFTEAIGGIFLSHQEKIGAVLSI